MISVRRGLDLGCHPESGTVLRAWLAGHPRLGDARGDLERFLTAPAPGRTEAECAPIWRGSWRRAWLPDLLRDAPDSATRGLMAEAAESLAAGRADPVVTGQQPGYLGGPLYTLLKVATAIVLADSRTAAGRPTVPVFWSGDDDDDLREAMAPVIYDPARDVLLRGRLEDAGAADLPGVAGAPAQRDGADGAGTAADRMIGELPATVAAGAGAWLAEQRHRGELARDLERIHAVAAREGWSWSRLQRRTLLRIFRGRPLLVVSGNDPGLHAAAAPLYRAVWADRARFGAILAGAGDELESGGFPRPLPETAGERILNLQEGGRRRALPAAVGGGDAGGAGADAGGDSNPSALPDVARLRPAVALRAAVQDWLFRPAGVVVGPGEVAYLAQLASVYAAFGVPRCAMLPRLFAWLAPAGSDPAAGLPGSDRGTGDRAAAAERVGEEAARLLEGALREQAGADPERARRLAAEQAASWSRQARRMLVREDRRRRRAERATPLPWLRPAGRRQERTLAALCAAALWGDDLTAALLRAAESHVEAGRRGLWCEFHLAVDEPRRGEGKERA
ncbi:MAG: bacillithiol biosynthesis BshC [Candidatus Krumholzibacteriia bacterium]